MPYALALQTGAVIVHSLTGETVHVDAVNFRNVPSVGGFATIKGHATNDGRPKVDEHAAGRHVTEIFPAGSLAVYRGTFADCHGLYRVRAQCTCAPCLAIPHEYRYVIDPMQGDVSLAHVRAASLAISAANCPHCYPSGQPVAFPVVA